MGINRRQAMTAPPARPPRYSLIGVAETLQLSDELLAGGYTFDPEACGSNRGGIAELGCAGDITPPEPPAAPELVVGDPFVIWAADECSTLGFNARDYEGRATRMLNASQSYWLAQALWHGDTINVAQPSLMTYAYDEISYNALSITEAVAQISAGLAYTLRGERGMIHMSPSNLDRAVAAGVAIRDGNLWVTSMGHVIVADAGYDGAGPDAAEQSINADWIYGTDMISVALGDVEIIPGSFADATARAQMVDRSINLLTIYAERLATWISTGCEWVCAPVIQDERVRVQNADNPGPWSITALAGYTVVAGGTEATLSIYDATTADMSHLVELVIVPANESRTVVFDPPIQASGGVMYVEPTDTVAALIRYVS